MKQSQAIQKISNSLKINQNSPDLTRERDPVPTKEGALPGPHKIKGPGPVPGSRANHIHRLRQLSSPPGILLFYSLKPPPCSNCRRWRGGVRESRGTTEDQEEPEQYRLKEDEEAHDSRAGGNGAAHVSHQWDYATARS